MLLRPKTNSFFFFEVSKISLWWTKRCLCSSYIFFKQDIFRMQHHPSSVVQWEMRRFDPLSSLLKREHANIFALASTLLTNTDKGSNLPSITTWSVLGKENVQVKKVYSHSNSYFRHSLSYKPLYYACVTCGEGRQRITNYGMSMLIVQRMLKQGSHIGPYSQWLIRLKLPNTRETPCVGNRDESTQYYLLIRS